MTIAINKTAAFAALNKFANARVQLIQALHNAGYTVESSRGVVIEWACNKTGATFNVSKGGKVMLNSAHPKYEAAKTVVRDVMHMVQGTTRHASSAKKESDPVANALKALAKLTPAQLKKVLAAVA
jgi:protein-arginine kinase activator protein McsA